MRIIARRTLVNYYTEHPRAKEALEDWYHKTHEAEWTCFADMKKYTIDNEQSYEKALLRVEELESIVGEDTPKTDASYMELDELIDSIDKYEEKTYPIAKPSFIEVLKLRMYEMGLNKTQLSQLVGVSVSSINSYLRGTREPSLPVARRMSKDLHISSDIVLGV